MTVHSRIPRCTMLVLLAGLVACGEKSEEQVAPPPTPVAIVTVRAEALPNVIELLGRIEAVKTAEVRARTNGIVLRRLYKEGTDVQEGTPLFQIDPREYRAQVQQAQAALQRAMAARANAASVVERYRPLVADRSVSGQENDSAVSQLRQADAQVAEARAMLAQNQLQLGFTTVRAPLSGRVGTAEVTEGALVSGAEATLMTRVDQLAPVYAVFTQSNSAILDMVAQVRSGELKFADARAVKVRLTLANGADYGVVGQLDFAGEIVDPQTGSQTIRAVFANPARILAPGQFVRARIIAGTVKDGFAVPARAVQFQGQQASVSVVGQNDTMVARPVQLGAQIGGRWIVLSGLKPGDRVVTDGWQKVRPGQKVAPRDAGTTVRPSSVTMPKPLPAAPAGGR